MIELIGLSVINWISWASIGVFAATFVYLLDKDNADLVPTFITAIVGAIAGGVLSSLIFDIPLTIFNVSSFLISLTGALLLSIIGQMLRAETEKEVQKQPTSKIGSYENAYFSEIPKVKNHLSDIKEILNQVEFPISSRDLIRYAEKHQADSADLNLLEKLPDHIYQGKIEIIKQIKDLG